MKDKEPWFAPKWVGYGTGLPIAWQGWALLLGYVALAVGSALLLAERQPALLFAILLPATIVLVVIAKRRTRGGWRWRWAGEDVEQGRRSDRRSPRERREDRRSGRRK